MIEYLGQDGEHVRSASNSQEFNMRLRIRRIRHFQAIICPGFLVRIEGTGELPEKPSPGVVVQSVDVVLFTKAKEGAQDGERQ